MARGMDIPVMGSFNEPDDNTVARISAESIEQAILDIGSAAECDAVFVACTSLRVARIVERVEQKLGKPVTSSNHALAWHMLRLGGVPERKSVVSGQSGPVRVAFGGRRHITKKKNYN